MGRVDKDEEREERIRMEILVDTYTPGERAVGWHHYLMDHMAVSFEGRCIEERKMSPLVDGETVPVNGMASVGACLSDMLVMVEWMNRELGVPLAQLEPIDVDSDTEEAIADWHYWDAQGYHIA